MNDSYVECLVAVKQSLWPKIGKWILIVLTVVLAIGAMVSMLFAILAVLAGVGAYVLHLQASVEYEYLYLDKELVIDKVMAQSRRKRVDTFDLNKMEILAPVRSAHLDAYQHRAVKVLDYSAKDPEQMDACYVMFYEGEKKILLTPSETLVEVIRNIAPRKVFTK